jgi:hypothetical protein
MEFDFFTILYMDKDFCISMGKMTLAAGRFESDLKEYLRIFSVNIPEEKATLGMLISQLRKNGLLSRNGEMVLKDIKKQRNYLTHNLYNLFSERIDETILTISELIPEDVSNFTEHVYELEYNLNSLSKIIESKINKIRKRELKIEDHPLILNP